MILACLGFIYATLLTVIYQMQSFTNEKNGMVVFKRCELNFLKSIMNMRTMMVITQRLGVIGSMCGTTGDWTRACVVGSCSCPAYLD